MQKCLPDLLQPEDLVHNQLDVSLQRSAASAPCCSHASAVPYHPLRCSAHEGHLVYETHVLKVLRDDAELRAIWFHL